MYQFEYPWLFVLLPLPLLLWWLLPPYREESPSVRLPFFGEVASAVGLKPAPGAVVPRSNWLQRILAPLAWALLVTALARPQFLEAPIEKVQPARDLLLALDLSQSMDTQDFRDPAGALVPRVQAVREVVSRFVTRRPGDRALYLYAPDGLGRSPLAEALARSGPPKGVVATSRNWNTVLKLVELTRP